MSLNEASAKDRLNLFKLEDASQYLQWQRQLQEYLFKKIRNVNMDKLKDSGTLDSKFFEKHAEFKEEFKTLKSAGSPLSTTRTWFNAARTTPWTKEKASKTESTLSTPIFAAPSARRFKKRRLACASAT